MLPGGASGGTGGGAGGGDVDAGYGDGGVAGGGGSNGSSGSGGRGGDATTTADYYYNTSGGGSDYYASTATSHSVGVSTGGASVTYSFTVTKENPDATLAVTGSPAIKGQETGLTFYVSVTATGGQARCSTPSPPATCPTA